MALVPLIAFGVAALGLVVLGIAGPAYRLGAALPTAYAIMRWAEYIGLVALLIGTGGAVYAYRQRKWSGAIVSALAMVLALTTIAIPLTWQRRAQSLPLIHDLTTDLENPPAFQAVIAKRGNAPNTLDRSPQLAVLQRDGYPDLAPVTLPNAARGDLRSRARRRTGARMGDRDRRQVERPHRSHRDNAVVRVYRRHRDSSDPVGCGHTS